MLEIYAVRHGRTTMNEQGKLIGWSDVPLVPDGVEDARKAAIALAEVSFAAIFSSDLRRARMTADVIHETLRFTVPITETTALREVDYGPLSGTDQSTLLATNPRFKSDLLYDHEGGESFQHLFERVHAFLENIKGEKGPLLLVTHAGCVRALLAIGTSRPFQELLRVPIPNGGILRCVFDDDGRPISAVFLTPDASDMPSASRRASR